MVGVVFAFKFCLLSVRGFGYRESDQMGPGLRFLPLGPFFIPGVTTVLFEVLVSALLSS